jgi:hypothetical protein
MLAEIFMVQLEATLRGSQDQAPANARFVPFDRSAYELEKRRRALSLQREREGAPRAGDASVLPGRTDPTAR